MPSNIEYLEYALELLKKCENVTYKKMMGEYLLYCSGTLFGGVYDDRFLIKATKSNQSFNLPLELPYEGAKMMYLVNSENKDEVLQYVANVVSDLKK